MRHGLIVLQCVVFSLTLFNLVNNFEVPYSILFFLLSGSSLGFVISAIISAAKE